MPSYRHEILVRLFRNHSRLAADLLDALDVQLSEYDEVRTDSSDLSNVQPAEYRADLVLLLMRESQKVLGVIVEVQLRPDEDKPYAWPAYIANLRARHRCPVCLLVITIDYNVERWAAKSIELGPGTRCVPCVIGPTNMPTITDLQDALENVELAVLSAIEHAQSPDAALTARIASAAILAISRIDAERSRMYVDLIYSICSDNASEALKTAMNSLGFEYQSDFARRYFFEGKAEGKEEGKVEGRAEGKVEGKAEGRAEGQAEVILKLLEFRFGPLTEANRTSVRGAKDAQLDTVVKRMLTAQTLQEALSALY